MEPYVEPEVVDDYQEGYQDDYQDGYQGGEAEPAAAPEEKAPPEPKQISPLCAAPGGMNLLAGIRGFDSTTALRKAPPPSSTPSKGMNLLAGIRGFDAMALKKRSIRAANGALPDISNLTTSESSSIANVLAARMAGIRKNVEDSDDDDDSDDGWDD